ACKNAAQVKAQRGEYGLAENVDKVILYVSIMASGCRRTHPGVTRKSAKEARINEWPGYPGPSFMSIRNEMSSLRFRARYFGFRDDGQPL
ncbi:hypothetical protein SB719_20335, partial [Pantoea sp. SIMBA_079]|uniref:hypothetical protein n=1 Tax=Pantoea sp. SIMBA_079 TaxID=3085817 RepID=UPI0039939D51